MCRIHIVYAKAPAEVLNRQAALGSYIHTLGSLLAEMGGYEVVINGNPLASLQQHVNTSQSARSSGSVRNLIPSFLKRIVKEYRLLASYKQLFTRLSEVPADLILEFYSFGSDLGLRLSRAANIPLIVVYDAPVLDEYRIFHNNQRPVFNKLVCDREKSTLEYASSVIVYSEAVAAHLKQRGFKVKCFAIHQNIDFSRFRFSSPVDSGAVVNIGFLGSFLKWHNVPLLLQAFEQLRRKGMDLRLFLLGTGAEYEDVARLVAASDFKNDIVLPGFVDGETLQSYKEKLHIGVMPGSNWYGAPNKIFEYGAAGLAVVAPRRPTITELFKEGEEVIFFDEGNIAQLTNALAELSSDATLRSRIAQTLQKKIRNTYSKNNTFELYNELIQKAVR